MKNKRIKNVFSWMEDASNSSEEITFLQGNQKLRTYNQDIKEKASSRIITKEWQCEAHLRVRKWGGGKLPGPGTENSQDLLCFNCKIIRQASKRTWHLAPKGGVCVKERFVWKTYCWCQHTLNYTPDSLESRVHKARQTRASAPEYSSHLDRKKIMGNYTSSACIVNYYNHLLYTALLNIPAG